MPEVALVARDRIKLEQVAAELDLAIDEFLFDTRDHITCDQWQLLLEYSRACVRRVLEVGLLLHGIVDSQCARIEYPGRGREVFVRQALSSWKDSFAPVAEVWKLAPVFASVPGGEQRVLADVATLEVMAMNRMFDSLDAESAAFFS